MGDTYHTLQDDEVIKLDMDEPWVKIACCDCGLVHLWSFGLAADEDGKIFLEIDIDRMERCTAQKRRQSNVEFLTNEDSRWTMVRK